LNEKVLAAVAVKAVVAVISAAKNKTKTVFASTAKSVPSRFE
jgi:hypothetical protein